MVNLYIIVYCAITCYILGVKFSPGNSNIIIIMYNISWLMEINLWRGGRWKAERAKGRAGSKTSGESVGKGIMINTCIWFQWLPGRLEKAPAGLQWGGSNEQQERERPTAEEEQNNHHRRRAPEFCLRFDTSVLFCVIKHPFSGSPPLTSSSFLPWPSNRVTILYSEFISCNSEFLIPDLRSNFRLLEFLGTDLQPFLIWVDLFQLFRCGLHSRVNQNWSV